VHLDAVGEEEKVMSGVGNEAFINEYLAAISGRPKPRELLDRFIDDENLKKHIEASEAAFPCYRVDPEELIAEGDLVSVRATVRGEHQGPFAGSAPTGKGVEFDLYITYRVSARKIVDHWMFSDNMALVQQFGLVTAPTR
jgi:predicted ester cyclase